MNNSPLDSLDARAIALAYLVFGVVGMLGGELFLFLVFGTPLAPMETLQKGLFFIGISSVLVGILAAWKDRQIERQQASVRSSLNQLKSVLDASPVAILAVTPDGRVTRWNEAASETFGWKRHEVVGELLPIIADDRREEVEALLQQSIEEGGLSNHPVERRRKDGEKREFLLSTALVRDADGEVTEIVGVFVDITEQKRREHRLREFEMAVEQAGHAICLTQPDGEITYVNPAFEHITGYNREEATGKTPSILKSGEMDDSYYDTLWETIKSGSTWQEKIVDQRKNGEFYTASQTIAPIAKDGEILGYVAIQSDITESKLIRQRLGVLNRMLRHNLRNRVNVVEGYAEMIRTNAADEELVSAADNILKASGELVTLADKAQTVTDLLEADEAARSIRDIVDTSVSRAESRYPDATVELNIEPDCAAQVDNRIGVAIDELVANALEHGGETVRIDVSLSSSDEAKLVIRVSDDGPGLPESEWNVIQRGEETPLKHGTGMGLWLVHWIVTKAGGSMQLDSTNLGGASVVLELPVGVADDTKRSERQSGH
ncbi:PAS domain-containing sensor histidine kinase (plasmid) [Haloferax mediterranei ATCC 33500]|uniref:histidine kinase n=1 Tax=Haloferax mediterranei (strain ATCC 33500 / DSM 1411 / JCM 8866 / NBRC 14739 / NCIMB 2177 / R-4) TaxID=523841 RepID=I3RAY5_HALMT|nr:PAS domain S-box protein [Haloferax mediterranei]AFK21395.1 signal-transducing histidine kinase-like protein [Haloferax mediterranei ATCC 33500]AHZ24532.1 histidine kinase [Haloferax mediterranei ATCC 33500]ELZ97284.1 signal-transducing histidine kinase-like protein [Haloferax mediterranei ATCC 33500]MDX5990414.1 PAS domain-containing sensor histidine kinase [Haloferax mediterranei ATCC 33500]QCQ76928.1 PAS domain-containing sensor histidine kinase [Haloferax mediterranei ATCC 33500]